MPAFVLPIITAFAFLLAWQAISVFGHISRAILPPPTMVLGQLAENFPLIMRDTYPTTIETLATFLISIPRGIVLAALIVYSTLAQQALYPNIVFFHRFPKSHWSLSSSGLASALRRALPFRVYCSFRS